MSERLDRRFIPVAVSMLAPLALTACQRPPLSTDDPLAQTWSATPSPTEAGAVPRGRPRAAWGQAVDKAPVLQCFPVLMA